MADRMHLSTRGKAFLARTEGMVPAPYYDQGGLLTIFIGHTSAAGEPWPSSFPLKMPTNIDGAVKEGLKVFEKDILIYEQEVIDNFGTNMAQHEFDGIVTWHFNTGGAAQTAAARYWRAGDKVRAVAKLMEWNKVTRNGRKVISEGLVERRGAEANLIITGDYPNDLRVPIYRTDDRGHIRTWQPIGFLSVDDFGDLTTPAIGGGIGTALAATVAGAVALVAAVLEPVREFIANLINQF